MSYCEVESMGPGLCDGKGFVEVACGKVERCDGCRACRTESLGGVPEPAPLERILERDDGMVGALAVAGCSATGSTTTKRIQARFAALGRAVRAASREDQVLILSAATRSSKP